MDEHFGARAGELLQDVDWLNEVADSGWVVLHKDLRMRRREHELAAIERHGLRVFCLANGNLPNALMAAHFDTNLNRIIQAARKNGPYIYGVYEDHIERKWPVPGGLSDGRGKVKP